jgi:Serine dehydrogenase proteinase
MPTKIETAAGNADQTPAADGIEQLVEAAIAEADAAPAAEAEPTAHTPTTPGPEKSAKKPPHWATFLSSASQQEIKERFAKETSEILAAHGLERECCIALLEPADSIDSFDLDQIFSALLQLNVAHDKNVVLFILSRGGEGEPAYQISKTCKSFASQKFIAVVPRHAKSAATLIAIGADEIHMGPLGQLGPIDPQIGGLPALGVSQALKTIASVAELYPKSAEMFARYLRMALTVEQIGYCDRITESAVQYAERLLSTKPALVAKAPSIARQLVHEYKDHNFVIDIAEAQEHLGADWIRTGTRELQAAELIYSLFETVNLWLSMMHSKRIVLSGGAGLPQAVKIFDNKRQ